VAEDEGLNLSIIGEHCFLAERSALMSNGIATRYLRELERIHQKPASVESARIQNFFH